MILAIVLGILIALVAILTALLAWAYAASTYEAPVTADEVHMVATSDLWRIRLCRHKAKKGPGHPVFLCHGFMSNQCNFSIPQGECMAGLLAEQGYDCWLIDLRGARSSIPPEGRTINDGTIDDHLFRDIPAAIEFIRKTTGFDKVHWIGHSMGGMLLYAYDEVFGPKHLASGTTLGAPIGFEGVNIRPPGFLLVLRRSSWHLFRALQRIFIGLVVRFKPQSGLLPINWKNMNHRLAKARDLFIAIDAPPIGVAESLASAANTSKWYVNDGTVEVFESLVRLDLPLFAIFGGGDPFVPIAAAKVFFENLPTKDKRFLLLSKENGHAADYNHVDLTMGAAIATDVVPPIVEWLKAHPIQRTAS